MAIRTPLRNGRRERTSGNAAAVPTIVLTAVIDRPACEERLQSIEMTLADDSAVVGTLLRVLAVELNYRFCEVLEELLGNVLEHQDVICPGASLAGVLPATLGDSACRNG